MKLPDKVQTAIAVLNRYDIPAGKVAPFLYRYFLRFRPDTPPPLWGATEGYWTLVAFAIAMVWGTVAVGAVAYLTWQESFGFGSGRWGVVFALQGIIWAITGVIGWAIAREAKSTAEQEARVLGLPDWVHFHAAWHPALDRLHRRRQVGLYWLHALVGDKLVQGMAIAGMLAFFGVAFAFPQKAGSYAEGTATAYLVLCVMGISRTKKQLSQTDAVQPPALPRSWRCSQGFWMGSISASVAWSLLAADSWGVPAGGGMWLPVVAALGMHLSEWWTFAQRKDLSQRAEGAEQSRQLAEVRLQMLKNQIEPHFIFNTLAHLKALIQSDPAVAESMADELSDFLRASLQALREDRMTVAQDFELVRAYLALASLRMGSRLSVSLQMEPATAHLDVPPLMLQTLVENAIQHGIEPKEGQGHIRVSARLDATPATPRLVLQVADDGVGFGQAKTGGSGMGLVNIRERLATAFGDNAQLALSANTPQGVIATLSLPAKTSV